MNKSESIAALAAALSVAQGAFASAKKSSDNPFFKSKYADLHAVIEASKEPMTKNGLSVVQIPSVSEGRVILETILMHSSGEWISGVITAKPEKDTPQGTGSCISYLRRYALSSFLNIGQQDDTPDPGDDDGNEASGNPEVKKTLKSRMDEPGRADIYTGTQMQKNALFARCSKEGISTDKMKDINTLLHDKKWEFLDTLIVDAKAEMEKEKK